jgi:hypothetical protein
MSRFIIAMIVGGGVLVFMTVQDLRLRSIAKDKPQYITCADLQAKGPGENVHVMLGEYLLCSFSYVYEEKSAGTWSKVWVPAVPVGGAYHQQLLAQVDEQGNVPDNFPLPNDVKVIIKSNDVDNEAELLALGNQQTLQGMVVNLVDSLGSEEKKILQESYPSVNFDECYIIEVDRKPASTGKLLGTGLGGLGLMAAGGFIFLAGRRSA